MTTDTNAPTTIGQVYLIECVVLLAGIHICSFFKIGTTVQDMDKRMMDLQTGCPFLLTFRFAIAVPNPYRVEKEAQRMFSHRWERGEWFLLRKSDVAKLRKFLMEKALEIPA